MDEWLSFVINYILFDYRCWYIWYIIKILSEESLIEWIVKFVFKFDLD